MRSGLFIGRFQPYHLGHKSATLAIAREVDYVVIGIGSADKSHMADNPFTAKERADMIARSLGSGVNYTVVQIPDIHDYRRWVEHVVSVAPKFDVVYTNNALVRDLFEKSGYCVRGVRRDVPIDATDVREMIRTGSGFLAYAVPRGTLEVIAECGGEKRLRDIFESAHGRPSLTVDALVMLENKLLLVRRKHDPFKDMWALPGGFVEKECIEDALRRELMEETSLAAKDLVLIGVYSALGRDPRGHVVSVAYEAKAEGTPKAGDDAKELGLFSLDSLPPLAFDHKMIIEDYLSRKKT